jgi:hypothetical protein
MTPDRGKETAMPKRTRSTAPVYNPLAIYERPDGTRAFTNAKLQSAIDMALSKARDDEPFLAVAHHVFNQDGTQVENVTKASFFVRLPKGLSIACGGYKDWTKPKAHGVGAEIVWRPK